MSRQELKIKLSELKKKQVEHQEELNKIKLQILDISKQLSHNLVGCYFKDRYLHIIK